MEAKIVNRGGCNFRKMIVKKIEELFNYLELSCFHDASLPVFKLENINTSIKVCERNGYFLISRLDFRNFLPDKIVNLQGIRLVVIF